MKNVEIHNRFLNILATGCWTPIPLGFIKDYHCDLMGLEV